MSLGSWLCLKNLGSLFDKGTFIWQWGTFIWDGGSFIWHGGTFIWQEGTFILRVVTILYQIIKVTKFWSCVRTLTLETELQKKGKLDSAGKENTWHFFTRSIFLSFSFSQFHAKALQREIYRVRCNFREKKSQNCQKLSSHRSYGSCNSTANINISYLK